MSDLAGLSDADLVRRMAAGNEDAFVALYRRRQGAVYRFAWQMSGSSAVAEEVTQEVFLVLIESAGRYDASRGPVLSWLFGVARNRVLRWLEKDGYYNPNVEEMEETEAAPACTGNGALVELERTETLEVVRQVVLWLPPHYWEAVVLVARAIAASVVMLLVSAAVWLRRPAPAPQPLASRVTSTAIPATPQTASVAPPREELRRLVRRRTQAVRPRGREVATGFLLVTCHGACMGTTRREPYPTWDKTESYPTWREGEDDENQFVDHGTPGCRAGGCAAGASRRGAHHQARRRCRRGGRRARSRRDAVCVGRIQLG